MDFFGTYHLSVYSDDEDGNSYCALVKRGVDVVGVGSGASKSEAVDGARQRARLHRQLASRLRDLMSEISERDYSAGWLLGLERALHLRVFQSPTEVELAALRGFAEALGAWWAWPDEADTPVRMRLDDARSAFGAGGAQRRIP